MAGLSPVGRMAAPDANRKSPMKADSLTSTLRPEARDAPESKIVEVMNYGRSRAGIIPLWAGEGDLPTPQFICDAATRALAAGETFYTWQRGIPELRQALADYYRDQFAKPFSPDEFFVTGSGMQAIQIVTRMLAGSGDEVIVPTPAWPNFAAATGISGARPVEVPMTCGTGGWSLDLARLADAITPRTRAIFVNSPSNPTGWVASKDDLREILALADRHGLWIVADEIYSRYFYGDGPRAPSFFDIAPSGSRILYVNTFSKNWAMTGWRVGWIVAPPELGQVIENLVQYSTSGVAGFMQRAALAALTQGDGFVEHQIERARRGRRIVTEALANEDMFRFSAPQGAFYLFFSVRGESDTRRLGLRLVDEANVGLAPGDAFGSAGAGFLRLCYLRSEDQLAVAATRLVDWARTARGG